MSDSILKNSTNIWEKIEHLIKKREQIILLLIIVAAIFFIPFKILSYGWAPSDDALRHVAFSTIDAKWSDVLVIDEKLGSDHNPGWHEILRFLYRHFGLDKTDLIFFSVCALFCLVNLCGVWASPSPICWCLALLIIESIDPVVIRMMLGRPYMVSCAATIVLLHIWNSRLEKDNEVWFGKNLAKYIITVVVLTLCVWIHGSWYLFLLIPASFFIAGKTKESLQLTGLILLSTILGAALSGDFYEFLYFHFVATFKIFSEPTYNWLLATEFASGKQNVYWILFVALLAILCNRKGKLQLKDFCEDPVFIMILLSWLCSIAVFRFWLDWGKIALLLWMSYRIGDLIKTSESLKQPRIRYCLSCFVIAAMVLVFINDGNGRYTKEARFQPIDFFSEMTQDKLKGWEPQSGGIVYSTDMMVFYTHFYKYPTAQWKYILGFEPAIMLPEDRKILRDIGYDGGRIPDDYLPWINKMTEKDRLILSLVPGNYPQLEWKKGNMSFWIGRLKVATGSAEISKP